GALGGAGVDGAGGGATRRVEETTVVVAGALGEHVVGGVHAFGWTADTDLHAENLGAAQGLDDRLDPAVAAVTAPEPQLHAARADVDVVVHEDEIGQADAAG